MSPRHHRCCSHQSELRPSPFFELKQGATSLVFRIRRWENELAAEHRTLADVDGRVRCH